MRVMKKVLTIGVAVLFTVVSFAQNVELDKSMGKANSEMVKQEMGIYENEAMTNYLRRIGQRLVSQLKKPLFTYQFHLVENAAPNAFALPGGYLYVTTGLLPILQSEDELACILGHEIIHSNHRHSVKQMKRSIFPKLLEVPGELIGLIDNDLGAILNKPIQTSNTLLLASYSRGFETEADKDGIALAARAGYDPNAMIPALTRLSKTVEVATNQQETRSYFNDHPFTQDRVKAIRRQVSKLKWNKSANESSNFVMEFSGALFGDSPRKGVVNENRFIHPELDFSIQFPENWVVVNENEYFAGINEAQNSGIQIIFEDPLVKPKTHADEFIKGLKPEAQQMMISQGMYKNGQSEGYLLSFKDKVDDTDVYAYALWIPFKDKLFRFLAIATEPNIKLLEPTVKSLKTLSKQERANIKIEQLVVVQAKKGETLEQLSKRVRNNLDLNVLAVINDKSTAEILREGEQIKVVKSYPYKK